MKFEGVFFILEKIFIRGLILILFFILVMYVGVLNLKWIIIKKLWSIRVELVIIGCIMMLFYGVIYFICFLILKFFKIMVEGKFLILYFSYIGIGIIGFIVMILLFIILIKKVRWRM